MPVPTPSMAHRAQPGARRPLNSQQDDNPNWARLAIIVTLLAVLAVGGYLGVTKLSGAGKNTSQVQPTPTSSYQPTGTPLFTDNFAANTYGWNLQSDEGNFSATIGGNSLTLQNNTHKLLWELLPGTRSYDNFEMAFDATLTKGDPNNGYGIYIRGASNNNTDLANYYRFELYGDGSYAIFKGATDAAGNTTDTRLVTYTGDSAINKVGKVNHVLIIANASKLTFIVNNQMLKTLTDTSYVSGTIAFFASNLAEAKSGATVQFANLVIYPAPGK